MKKKIIILAALTAALVAGAFFYFDKNNGNGPKYRTEPITRGDIEEAVTATGTINAVTTILVGTQVSGTIKSIYADFNSVVKKGQLIAQIDPATFEAQLEQARANLLSARAGIEKAEAAIVDAKRTFERTKSLYSRNLIPKSEMDAAETNYETSRASLSGSKAQASQAGAALKLSETNLNYTSILSPVNGIVISRNVDVGQTVAASFQTPTLFTIAEDLTKMQIDTNVNEADIGRVRSGQDVDFTVDAYPDQPFHGKVREIRNAPIIIQNVVTYDVVITVDNPELKLKPGMTANASIVIAKKSGVLRIPNAAFRFKPLSPPAGRPLAPPEPGSPGQYIWLLENNEPRRVRVTTGISDGANTELVSGDVKEGRQAIVESLTKQKRPEVRGPRMF